MNHHHDQFPGTNLMTAILSTPTGPVSGPYGRVRNFKIKTMSTTTRIPEREAAMSGLNTLPEQVGLTGHAGVGRPLGARSQSSSASTSPMILVASWAASVSLPSASATSVAKSSTEWTPPTST